MRAISVAVFALVFVPAACATGSTSDERTRRNPDLITQEELEGMPVLSCYEAVQRLRPAWLRSRGPISGGGATRSYPKVFLDGMPMGDINTLRDLRTENVMEFRFISARDATTRFGTGYMAGIIEIITRK